MLSVSVAITWTNVIALVGVVDQAPRVALSDHTIMAQENVLSVYVNGE